MTTISPVSSRRILLPVLALFLDFATQAAFADECSIAKTNKDCTLNIDRINPLAPPTIQMYPGHSVTVVVKNPYYFERYFLDYSSGQIAPVPDIASAIATGLLPQLKSLVTAPPGPGKAAVAGAPPASCNLATVALMIPTTTPVQLPPTTPAPLPAGAPPGPTPPPNVTLAPNSDVVFTACLNDFATSARNIYLELEPVAVPDSHPSPPNPALPPPNPVPPNPVKEIAGLKLIEEKIIAAYNEEATVSRVIAAAAAYLDPTKGTFVNGAVDIAIVQRWAAAAALADAVAKDLSGFQSRIQELVDHSVPVGTVISLQPIGDPPANHAKMITRQVTYNIDVYNVVQNPQEAIADPTKKKTIAAVTVFYGDARWELSAGTMFSTLAVRSFAVTTTQAGSTVTQSVQHPSVVPFAAANIRLGDEFGAPKWRMAAYLSFAAGINPDTTTADFGVGPSLSWRGLMFSAFWHVGHDVRLTGGLYTNETLPAGYMGGATTETYWRLNRVALGISVRVPSLTGR